MSVDAAYEVNRALCAGGDAPRLDWTDGVRGADGGGGTGDAAVAGNGERTATDRAALLGNGELCTCVVVCR